MKRKHQPNRNEEVLNEESIRPKRFKHLEGLSEENKQLIKQLARIFVAAVLRLTRQKT
jgi:hypothetical protein